MSHCDRLFVLSSVLLTGAISFAQEGFKPAPRTYASEVEPAASSVPAPLDSRAPRALAQVAARISPGLDSDHVAFDVDARGALWARGRTYKASFSRSGATYVPFLGSRAPRNFPVALHVESATVAGSAIVFDADATAVRTGDTIEYDRGAFREVFRLTPDSLEQTFVFDDLPARGEIDVSVSVDTELTGSETDAGFRFGNDLGFVQYGRASAGGSGRGLVPIESRLSSSRIDLVAPKSLVESSQGAFVIDPVLTTFAIDTFSPDTFGADTAYDLSTGTWLTVYEEVFSASDHDLRAMRHNTSGTITGNTYVDFTTDTWRTPAIADNNLDDQFLVVAAVGNAPARQIWGRTVEATVTLNMSAQFRIDSASQTGDHYAPDVGGDPNTTGATYYCVVWEREYDPGVDYDVHARLVRTDATFPGPTFFIDDSSFSLHKNPAISNSDGNAAAALRDWNVVWEDEVSATNHNILGARVHHDGSLTASTFTIASSTLDERNPSVTSIVDDTGGTRPWMVAWQIDDATNGWDIRCRTFDGTTNISTFDLSDQFPNVSLDQITPSCDTALGQFVVAWDERTSPLFISTDLKIATLYSIGGALGVNEGNLSVSPGAETDLRPKVSTQGSSGSSGDDAMVVFDRDDSGPNDVLGTGYDLPNGGPVTVYCSGDGSGTACPCGNSGAAGHGCASSVNVLGAQLAGPGRARVSDDTFQLVATDLPSTSPTLFFQGTTQTAGGAGAVFGDGLRCASGTVVRLATRTASGGLAYYPLVGTDVPISVKGSVPATGAVRYYQAWYRNSAAFCTVSTFNLTNGLRVQWIP
jgi:hypothetical protein